MLTKNIDQQLQQAATAFSQDGIGSNSVREDLPDANGSVTVLKD